MVKGCSYMGLPETNRGFCAFALSLVLVYFNLLSQNNSERLSPCKCTQVSKRIGGEGIYLS